MLIKSGAQKQHSGWKEKIALRKKLMHGLELKTAFYIPFCGDGDVATELYQGHKLYAADNSKPRLAEFKKRFPAAEIKMGDCDAFKFRGSQARFCLADFDAYAYPYTAFKSFWSLAQKASPLVLFFTDAQREGIKLSGNYRAPDGKSHKTPPAERSALYQEYFERIVKPWFADFLGDGWQVSQIGATTKSQMLYWGAIISSVEVSDRGKQHKENQFTNPFTAERQQQYIELVRQGRRRLASAREVGISIRTMEKHLVKDASFAALVEAAEREANERIEDALYDSALSGNVTAQQVWLYNRMSETWADKRQVGGTFKVTLETAAAKIAAEMGLPVEEVLAEAEKILKEAGRASSGPAV